MLHRLRELTFSSYSQYSSEKARTVNGILVGLGCACAAVAASVLKWSIGKSEVTSLLEPHRSEDVSLKKY